MKTIKRDDVIKRVSDERAKSMLNDGWLYTSKTEWKEKIRDFNKNEEKVVDENKKEEKTAKQMLKEKKRRKREQKAKKMEKRS